MSFGNYTPEALLARSDSKNPATTCKGLTAAGRPCRRGLAASASNSPAASPNTKRNGVVAILDGGDAAAFFCWQHKDQAEALVAKLSQRTQVLPLKEKNSIDTLIERIGVIDLEDEVGDRETRLRYGDQRHRNGKVQQQHSNGVRKRDTLPEEWQRMNGPLMRVPEEVMQSEGYRRSKQPSRHHEQYVPKRRVRPNVKASWGCCVQADEEDLPPPRRAVDRYGGHKPQRRPQSQSRMRSEPTISRRPVDSESLAVEPDRRRPQSNPNVRQRPAQTVNYPDLNPLSGIPTSTPTRPNPPPHSSTSPPNSQTAALLSLIPDHLSPTTTSALLSELSKPISSADEDGYIYIFWLTPESDISKPDDETATSLLDWDDISPTPSPSRHTQSSRTRRPSEFDRRHAQNRLTAQALQRFASVKHSPSEPQKILLKIGRASNVHRRLSQWTKQCGQNITLIRYYPYRSSSLSPSSFERDGEAGAGKRTVPHVHRVERLIHLELADQRVAGKGKCEQCGREHKEWFEVEATREGVKAVDEVVRRWVRWAEGTG